MNKSESKYFNTARRMDEALLSLLYEKDFEYITIKEICERAAVNRSTFYLHYENTADLLVEALEMINERFQNSIPEDIAELPPVEHASLDKLFFITDRWLIPYFEFVKENRRFYGAMHTQMDTFGVDRAYYQLFQSIFSPIMSRFGVEKKLHEYIMEFYRRGLTAVLIKWVEGDCKESAAEISKIVRICVGGGTK